MAAAARGRSLVGLGVAALFALESCACTAIGCASGFQIDFASTGGWPSGVYGVTITADGTTASATVALPFASCAVEPVYSGTHDWILIESGCALSANEHSLGGIAFAPDMPTHVDIVVTRDGRQAAVGSYAPSYQQSQPNGPFCGPTCYSAPDATLILES
jgi:hypothetical protein